MGLALRKVGPDYRGARALAAVQLQSLVQGFSDLPSMNIATGSETARATGADERVPQPLA